MLGVLSSMLLAGVLAASALMPLTSADYAGMRESDLGFS